VLDKKVRSVAQRLTFHIELVVRGCVHENVVVAVGVQVLHILTVDNGLFDLDASVEGLVDNCTGPRIADFGAHESATLAWLDVLKLDALK
jgi:hypothetical protein